MKREKVENLIISVLKAATIFGIYFLISLIVGIIIGIIFVFSSPNLNQLETLIKSKSLEISLFSNLMAILFIILGYVILSRPIKEELKLNIKFKNISNVLGVSVIIGVFLQLFVIFAVEYIPFPDSWMESLIENSVVQGDENLFLLIFAVGIVGPIAEELVFRAGVLKYLCQGFPKWIAIILSAVVFGIMHAGPIGFIYAGGIGIFMGWLFVATNSVIPSTLFHIVYNMTSILLPSEIKDITLIIIGIISAIISAGLIVFLNITSKGKNENEAL